MLTLALLGERIFSLFSYIGGEVNENPALSLYVVVFCGREGVVCIAKKKEKVWGLTSVAR